MSDLPDLSRTPLHQLQRREVRGRPFRRPSQDPTRIDCPEEDVLYVGIGMKTWTGGHYEDDGRPEEYTKIRICVYQKPVPAVHAVAARQEWQEKQRTVVNPLLATMRDGVESVLRSRGLCPPRFNWFDIVQVPTPLATADGLEAFGRADGLQVDFVDVPANARGYEAFVELFAEALDRASGYPSRIVHTYALDRWSEEERFSQIAALCVGQGHGQGIVRDRDEFGDITITSDEDEEEDEEEGEEPPYEE